MDLTEWLTIWPIWPSCINHVQRNYRDRSVDKETIFGRSLWTYTIFQFEQMQQNYLNRALIKWFLLAFFILMPLTFLRLLRVSFPPQGRVDLYTFTRQTLTMCTHWLHSSGSITQQNDLATRWILDTEKLSDTIRRQRSPFMATSTERIQRDYQREYLITLFDKSLMTNVLRFM